MLVFDRLLCNLEVVFKFFTKPLPSSSGIYVILRLCAITSGIFFFLSVVNNYTYIDCYTSGKDISLPAGNDRDRAIYNYLKAASTYCYMQGVFVTVNYTKEVSTYYGITNEVNVQETYCEYYQWVPFVLFFLLLIFWVPEHLWSTIEKKFTQGVINNLDKHLDEDEMNARIQSSAKYFVKSLKTRRKYLLTIIFSELLAVAMLISTFYLMDLYLQGNFLHVMPHALHILIWGTYEDFNRYMYKIFPKVGKCTFRHFGVSGTLETKDFICVLSLNVLYEKIFLLLWIILVIFAPVAFIVLFWHFALFISSWLRRNYLLLMSFENEEVKTHLKKILQKTNVGDDVMLLQCSSRMKYFPEWLSELHKQLRD